VDGLWDVIGSDPANSRDVPLDIALDGREGGRTQ
jgi:hypothetical protein